MKKPLLCRIGLHKIRTSITINLSDKGGMVNKCVRDGCNKTEDINAPLFIRSGTHAAIVRAKGESNDTMDNEGVEGDQ